MQKKEIEIHPIEEEQKKKNKGNKKKILGEILAFLILFIIVGGLTFGTWYWYKHVYDSTKNKKKNESKEVLEDIEYSLLSYKTEKELRQFNNYLVEIYQESIHKVMDYNTKVLYEGDFTFTNIFEGVDNSLYVVVEESVETENMVTIYQFADNSFKKITSLNESGVFLKPMLLNEKLIGFAGSYDTIIKEEAKDYLYLLEEKETKMIKDYTLEGNNKTKRNYVLDNPSTILVSQIKNTKKYYGVYDMLNERIILPCDYEILKEINDSTYVAKSNGKVGIIEKTGKNIIDFLYDFIEIKEDYFIVGKDNKMAIMDKNYEIKTDFVFEYQGTSYSYTNPNSFYSKKVNDLILLTVNYDTNYNYLANYTYVIKPDYSYDKIDAKYFNYEDIFYSYNDKTNLYTVYDEYMKKKYDLDLSKYSYDGIAIIRKINEATIAAKLDKDIYFDFVTGEELTTIKEPEDKEVTFGALNLYYQGSKEVSVFYKDKEQFKYEQLEFHEKDIIKKEENYYFNLGSIYYALVKKEKNE